MKRILAAVVVGLGLVAGATSSYAAGPSACVHLHVDINGTQQNVDQCAP